MPHPDQSVQLTDLPRPRLCAQLWSARRSWWFLWNGVHTVGRWWRNFNLHTQDGRHGPSIAVDVFWILIYWRLSLKTTLNHRALIWVSYMNNLNPPSWSRYVYSDFTLYVSHFFVVQHHSIVRCLRSDIDCLPIPLADLFTDCFGLYLFLLQP